MAFYIKEMAMTIYIYIYIYKEREKAGGMGDRKVY